MVGQIIDALIVARISQQRNSGDDNARIEEGETPEGWENQPAKRSPEGYGRALDQAIHGREPLPMQEPRQRVAAGTSWCGVTNLTDAALNGSKVVADILDGGHHRHRRCGRTAPIGRRRLGRS